MGQDPGRGRASTKGSPQGETQDEQRRLGKDRRRYQEALGGGESGRSATSESRRQEDGQKEGRCEKGSRQERGGEENGHDAHAARYASCRSIRELRHSLSGHGTCLATLIASTIIRCISSAPTSVFRKMQNCIGRNPALELFCQLIGSEAEINS